VAFGLPAGHETSALPPELGATHAEGQFRIEADDPTRSLFILTRWAIDTGIELQDLTVTRPSLEDVYLALVRDAEMSS
jgi:ABC-2 type transport system ATP-binding protein